MSLDGDHDSAGTPATAAAAQRLVQLAHQLPAAAQYAPEIAAACDGIERWGREFPPWVWDLLGERRLVPGVGLKVTKVKAFTSKAARMRLPPAEAERQALNDAVGTMAKKGV